MWGAFQGIDRERVEAMEARLKEDILLEAARYARNHSWPL